MLKDPQKTYLPVDSKGLVYSRLYEKDYEYLLETDHFDLPYERLGFDRLLAIVLDLSLLGIQPPASVLDIGCNVGLFSIGLSTLGYRATGIDNNIAADVQSWYPQPISLIAKQTQRDLHIEDLEFLERDVFDFVQEDQRTFDVCLLLSVVHQWIDGYAQTGIGARSESDVEQLLVSLSKKVRRVIYFEGPDTTEINNDMIGSFPNWFQNKGIATNIVPIATSPAANGYLRTVFRLEL